MRHPSESTPAPSADADFELARPAGPETSGTAGATTVPPQGPQAMEVPESDGAAAAPARGPQAIEEPGPAGTAAAPAQGPQAMEVPGSARAAAASAHPPQAAAETAVGTGAAEAMSPGPPPPVLTKQPAAPLADDTSATPPAPVSARPSPLHDPDPYDTPPYGEPGPWAPAPPVQHPTLPRPTPPADASAPTSPFPAPATPATRAAASAEPPPASAEASAPFAPPPASAEAPAPFVPPAQAPGERAASVSPPSGADGGGGEGTAGAGDPWGRYDPWAVAPLQESGAAQSGAAQRRRRVRRALVGGALALALVSGVLGGLVGAVLERDGGIGAVELPQAGKEPAGRAPDSVAGIAARALPSVVTLHVSGSGEQGTGTGFVLDGLGHILTNNHVVEPAASSGAISVTFSGGQTAKARVVGRDTGYDLAVVQVTGVRGLTAMPLGNSDNVQVGDPVVAIGAPFDLANTVTSGIISAKDRPITAGGEKGDGGDVSYVDALQTDAPINPGNSGGPLLDSGGRVIGVNSAIRSADTGSDVQTGQAGSIGLGFAIPVNQAKRVAEELINTGRASHPVIGVTLDMNYTGDGARVGDKSRDGGAPVTPGGPGAKAGIKAGDVITAVDGRSVHSGEELIVRTRAHRPGDRLRLTVRSGGRAREVTLVLGSAGG
ncbi:trypsin-like peptidase domain-containing protein [Streptomyces seoulensis]|nr:trypsin-like peptidase domain-containing protein [Streptomyces seoulensis]